MTTASSSLPSELTISDKFFDPVSDILCHYTRSSRLCDFEDADFLRLGVLRTLSQCKSGRDFIQQQRELYDTLVTRSALFGSLHSPRRLELLREVDSQLYARGSQKLQSEDLLQLFPELAQRAVWAADGHKIEHACHARRDDQGRLVAVNSLYLLCLHSGLLCPLGPVQGNGIYRHELPVFRRAAARWIQRQGQRRKNSPAPLFLLDPAFVDNQFWNQMRQAQAAGARVITPLKENMNPAKGKVRVFDRQDEVNLGVNGDLEITFQNGILMRLVSYTDPETDVCYQFLTTDFELRPGVIAWLYFLRWRIEKIFDTAKNKLEEHKAWANGEVAQEIQSHFLAITHNALILFRHDLQSEHGIQEDKLKAKRQENLQRRSAAAESQGRRLHPLTFKLPEIVQLTLQFIRALRNYIIAKARLRNVLSEIRAMLIAYL